MNMSLLLSQIASHHVCIELFLLCACNLRVGLEICGCQQRRILQESQDAEFSLAIIIAPRTIYAQKLTGFLHEQFPCGRVKRFLKNNTQNKMRVGAKGMFYTPSWIVNPDLICLLQLLST